MESRVEHLIATASQALVDAGAKEVYVFGSAGTPRWREGSDIDLAVSGIPPERFYAALAEASACIDVQLDVVDLDYGSDFVLYLKSHGELTRVR